MRNLKYITQATIAFMALCLPFLVHASTNSAVIISNVEGNVQCRDYGPNDIKSTAVVSDTKVGGSYNPYDDSEDADYYDDEFADYSIDLITNTLQFTGASTPIDYIAVKAKGSGIVVMYLSGGVRNDYKISISDPDNEGVNLPIASFNLCYGLNNEAAPTNLEPELKEVVDNETVNFVNQEVMVGYQLTILVKATDDGSPGNTLTLDAVGPVGVDFEDHGNNIIENVLTSTGTFTWTPSAEDLGTHSVIFTASDGSLFNNETISITVIAEPPEPEDIPSCREALNIDGVGVSCPAPIIVDGFIKNSSVICNFEVKKPFFGFVDESGEVDDACCACNSDPLPRCDPKLAAGTGPSEIGPPCLLTGPEKALLDLRPAEMPVILELFNDPYICAVVAGRRICNWVQ